MNLDELTKTLECIETKLDDVRMKVERLVVQTAELREDVAKYSTFPPKLVEVDTRLIATETNLRSIQTKTWTLVTLVVGSVVAAACSVFANLFME